MSSPDEARRALDVVVRQVALPVADDHRWVDRDRLDEVSPELSSLVVIAPRRGVVGVALVAVIPSGHVDAEQALDWQPVIIAGREGAALPRENDVRPALVAVQRQRTAVDPVVRCAREPLGGASVDWTGLVALLELDAVPRAC